MSRYNAFVQLAAKTPTPFDDQRVEEVLQRLPQGKELRVAHGYDHSIGYFVDIFDDQDEILVELSSMFDGLGHGFALGLLVELGVELTDSQRASLTLDMPY